MSATERRHVWLALFEEKFVATFRLVRNLGVDVCDVEDVVQRVYQVALKRITEVPRVERPEAWLRGIAVREVLHYRRWHGVRRAKRWLLLTTATAEKDEPPTPEQNAEAVETRQRVQEVLERMSPKLRDVLVLLHGEELALQEVARLLEIPMNTVRSRKRLAKEQFQRLWKQTVTLKHESTDG
jgi:RNA polymerase sigma-70 factor (ECF subfamily)